MPKHKLIPNEAYQVYRFSTQELLDMNELVKPTTFKNLIYCCDRRPTKMMWYQLAMASYLSGNHCVVLFNGYHCLTTEYTLVKPRKANYR